MRYLLLTMTILWIHAEEAPLPDKVLAEQIKYSEQIAEIIADAQKNIDKEKAKFIKTLEKEKQKATRRGQLETALAIKTLVDQATATTDEAAIETNVADLFGVSPGIVAPAGNVDPSTWKVEKGKDSHTFIVENGTITIHTPNNTGTTSTYTALKQPLTSINTLVHRNEHVDRDYIRFTYKADSIESIGVSWRENALLYGDKKETLPEKVTLSDDVSMNLTRVSEDNGTYEFSINGIVIHTLEHKKPISHIGFAASEANVTFDRIHIQ